MKKFKKLIPALALLLVSAVLMSTASYAWFSMNNKVTVTGMEVTTKVSNNLYVRNSTYGQHDETVTNYLSGIKQTVTGLLQPVSTTDGINFFYVDAQHDVNANGSVKSGAEYIAYTDSSAFTTNYLEAQAVPYVDYVFELKAVNTGVGPVELKLSELVLTYTAVTASSATIDENAYRVAVFMEKYDSAYTNTSAAITSSGTQKSILKESSSAYFTASQAVVSSSGLGAVQNLSQGVAFNVAAGATEYYQVIVRLWLEGEDTTCNNDTFVDLTEGNWKLDLAFVLGETPSATTVLSSAVVDSSAGA
ncbi:MAG: hypothetical protein K6F14_07975 [Clostridiales bacterium]|nr:hypothetical protein [Clostridiales bacterium]